MPHGEQHEVLGALQQAQEGQQEPVREVQAEAVGEGEVGGLEVLQPHAMTNLMMTPMMMMTLTMTTDPTAAVGESLPEGGAQRVREGRGVREVHVGLRQREVEAEVLPQEKMMRMTHRHQKGDGPQQLVSPSLELDLARNRSASSSIEGRADA